MGLSQAKLALLLGNNEQAIALWEKKSNIPQWATNMLRKLVSEHLGDNKTLMEIINHFNNLDKIEYDEFMRFEDLNNQWKIAA